MHWACSSESGQATIHIAAKPNIEKSPGPAPEVAQAIYGSVDRAPAKTRAFLSADFRRSGGGTRSGLTRTASADRARSPIGVRSRRRTALAAKRLMRALRCPTPPFQVSHDFL